MESRSPCSRVSLLFQAVDKTLIATESAPLLMFLHTSYMSAEYVYLFCASGPTSLEGRFSLKYLYSEILFSLAVLKSPEAIIMLVCAVIMVYVKTLLNLIVYIIDIFSRAKQCCYGKENYVRDYLLNSYHVDLFICSLERK